MGSPLPARHAIRLLAVGFSVTAFAAVSFTAANASTDEAKSRPMNVILFIGDGMQLEHERATSRYFTGDDYRLKFHSFPYSGYVATWDVTTYDMYAKAAGRPAYDPASFDPSLGYDPARGGRRAWPLQNSGVSDAYFLDKLPIPPTFDPSKTKQPATDSASAATAWATGYKTDDGNLAWLPGDPPDGKLPTIAELVRARKGAAIGVVSTVPFTHATPAAHVSHNVSRGNYVDIAEEILFDVQPDVVIGGGYGSWNGSTVYVTQDQVNRAAAAYEVVQRAADVDGAVSVRAAARRAARNGKKLFGLFGGPGGNFEPPEVSDTPRNPTVKRGSTENPLLRDATVAALDVLSRDPDGMFLMVEQGDIDWANHANDFSWMIGATWDLDQAVRAAIAYVDGPKGNLDWSNTLLIVTSDHANSYMRIVQPLRRGDLPREPVAPCAGYGGAGVCVYPDGEVSYRTTNHTNELVRIYAKGDAAQRQFSRVAGTWYRRTAIIDNTQLFDVMAAYLRLPDRSPLVAVAPG